jgi:sortase A
MRTLLLRALGGLALVAGLVGAGVLTYQLWWADVRAAEHGEQLVSAARAEFEATPASAQVLAAPGDAPTAAGDGIPAPEQAAAPDPGPAIVHLPTIGEELPVLEGVGADVLDQGVLGRYPGSGAPGEVGNYAVAGHRTTYGRPLWALGDLEPGDPVVVETARGWHVYRFEGSRVTVPEDVTPLAPTPDSPGVEPEEARMVLTTCHPRFSARQRLIGYAVLDRTVPRESGPPPELAPTR